METVRRVLIGGVDDCVKIGREWTVSFTGHQEIVDHEEGSHAVIPWNMWQRIREIEDEVDEFVDVLHKIVGTKHGYVKTINQAAEMAGEVLERLGYGER